MVEHVEQQHTHSKCPQAKHENTGIQNWQQALLPHYKQKDNSHTSPPPHRTLWTQTISTPL